MENTNTWIFYDKENNLWKFILKENGHLAYNIMYSEDRWTNESKIDTEVLEFNITIDKDQNIHIIYSKKGKLKYCIWNKDQWLGKVLYGFEASENEIRELTLIMVENRINAFFILKNINNPSRGSLMHYIWREENAIINSIHNIMLIPNADNHYHVEIVRGNNISIFFINNKEPEIEVKNFVYKKPNWSFPKKLYDIKGSKINFSTIFSKNKIHILNLSKEKDMYSLETVYIDFNGEMKYDKLFEGKTEITDPILIEKNNILWAMWREQKDIICSSFENEWNAPFRLDTEEGKEILLYNCIFGYDNEKIKGNKILGTDSYPIKFFLPESSLRNVEEEESEKDNNSVLNINEEKDFINEDISNLSELNEELESIVVNLKLQLKQKENIIGQLEEQLSNIIYKNKKIQEKCNIFKQVHEESQDGLKERKKQLDDLQEKLEETIKENENLNLEIEKLKKEKEKLQETLNKTNLDKEHINNELEVMNNKRKELKQNLEQITIENETMRKDYQNITKEKEELQNTLETLDKQLDMVTKEKEEISLMLRQINKEKNKLQRDLEAEMNKSIISKIWGRRDDT
ncbi:hypothetical protein [Clostridium sp. Marseille-QA1073]